MVQFKRARRTLVRREFSRQISFAISTARKVFKTSSSVQYWNFLRRSSSNKPEINFSKIRIGPHLEQQSLANSHLCAMMRTSFSHLSTDWFSRCFMDANCRRQMWRFRPALQCSRSLSMISVGLWTRAWVRPKLKMNWRVGFDRTDRRSRQVLWLIGEWKCGGDSRQFHVNLPLWCHTSNKSLCSSRSNRGGVP